MTDTVKTTTVVSSIECLFFFVFGKCNWEKQLTSNNHGLEVASVLWLLFNETGGSVNVDMTQGRLAYVFAEKYKFKSLENIKTTDLN